ncbi:hypothetical protein DFP72DRAFT_1149273 [Ephemerocybe angulata]|uniref:F-box domain-containing protein n=1 Tax=Ephemerocybe angulata TaxID=980116 RepID=A0A8H6HI51_9AGAR|nr:hypothetical protein DFP72DRAFT_1149273 [Tulosesus angulatus]
MKSLTIQVAQNLHGSPRSTMESQDGSSDMLSDSYFVPPPLEVATMRQQIPPMMTEISELRSRLEELEDRVYRYRSATSPLRRIPPEILGEIFHVAMGSQAIDFEGKKDLTVILLVCKKWRDAAYLAGKLWTCISLRLPRTTQMSYEKVSNWIGRSKGSPKTLKIVYDPDRCFHPTQSFKECELAVPLLVKLLVEGPLLHRLEIHFVPSWCFQELMDSVKVHVGHDLTKSSWSQLQELVLRFQGEIDRHNFGKGEEDVSQSVFRHIPPLRSLTLSFPTDRRGVALTRHIHLPPTSLQTLTNFHLRCEWDGPQIFVFLQHCQNLQTLTLTLGVYSYCTWKPKNTNVPFLLADPGYIILPNLRTLAIRGCTIQNAKKLANHIRVPSLLDLRVAQWPYLSGSDDSVYNALVALSPIWVQTSTLRFLTLEDLQKDSKIYAKELTDILSRFGNITHFATSFDFNAKDFLELQKLGDAVRLLPSLEHLEITHIREDFDLESFFQYIEHRRMLQSNDEGQADRLKMLTLSGQDFLGQVRLQDSQLYWVYQESSYPQLLKESFGIVVNFLPRGSPIIM